MTIWPGIFYVLFAFISGSVPWSWLLGKFRGFDIRKEGSGNTGATNLFRVCGRGAGFTGLFLDVLKGAVPVLAAKYGIPGFTHPAGQWILAAACIFAVMGHVFTPWLGFRGGKGVATTFGVLLVLSPLTVAAGFVMFIFVLLTSKYVSLGSISAAVAMVPAVFILEPGRLSVQIIICLVAVLIVARHRSNIVRLLRGEEKKFSFSGGKDD